MSSAEETLKLSDVKAKKPNLRYQYDSVPSFEESELTTSQMPNLISIDEDSDSSLEQSLTSRRREFILSKPVQNFSAYAIFQRAKRKMKGFRMFTLMLEDIRLYGTGSLLFDAHNSYKKNIQHVMKKKYVEEKVETEAIKVRYTVFLPDSIILSIWNTIILFFLGYTLIIMPWLISFTDNLNGEGFWYYFDTTVAIGFGLDILVIFNTAYTNKDGKVIYSRKSIALNYIRGTFIIDCVSVFPFTLLPASENNSSSLVRLLRMARLTRIVRASRIVKILDTFLKSDKVGLFFTSHQGVARLFSGIAIIAILVHLCACMWYYSAKLDNFNPDTWVVVSKMVDESSGYLYLASMYWAVTVLTTVGFGDIHATTEAEMIISIIWMIFGIGFYSFVVGSLSSVLSSMDEKKSLINAKMQLIDLFSKDTMLPPNLTLEIGKKIKIHLETLTLDDNERSNIISDLPKTLRYDIGMSMFQCAAQKINFFSNKEVAFLADILPRLKHTIIKPKQFLYKKGDYADEAYFIVDGRVGFVYGRNNLVFKNMISGSYFGEIELIEQSPREFSVLSEWKTELLILTKNIFDIMMIEYPRVAQELKQVSEERKRRNNSSKQEIIDLLETVELKKEVSFNNIAGQQKIERVERKLERKKTGTSILSESMDKGLSQSFGQENETEYVAMRSQMKGVEDKLDGLDTKLTKILSLVEREKRQRSLSPGNKKEYLPPIHPKSSVYRTNFTKDAHI
ncbi:unnamed protein product [Blepharisma stoltei]|uniref:Cyclic nucleotide-binding domain-containing protein n=1 Tax=Blepharisma stoltei TaxID=1481888 RepID=A0AAU9JCG8_9CILI|nr:unnamed protein product [Blepharisma stoltei]